MISGWDANRIAGAFLQGAHRIATKVGATRSCGVGGAPGLPGLYMGTRQPII